MTVEHAAFDRALLRRGRRFALWPEQPEDSLFIHDLTMRCSALGTMLPAPLLREQAWVKEASHRAAYPMAMRRVVSVDGVHAGRIVVDWGTDRRSHGVDIAVLPELRSSGLGLHMLRSWLEVADAGQWHCTLDVNRDNPAVRVYARLGFRAADEQDKAGDSAPFMRMVRPRASRPAGAAD